MEILAVRGIACNAGLTGRAESLNGFSLVATASGDRILHKPITGEELREAIVAACIDDKESINSGC